jgi:hypothetical protein
VVLIAVLVVVAILMLVGYQFHRWMSAEAEAVAVSNRLAQGRALADSGLHYAAFVLGYPDAGGLGDGNGSLFPSSALLSDNPAVFHHRPVVGPSPAWQGYYSIVVPREPEDPLAQTRPYRYGVEDESGKLNVNTLRRLGGGDRNRARDMLMKLPNMTQETADAILNWTRRLNENSDSANADAAFYASLGYSLKQGPYETAEELLLIRGITPRLFLGNDQNRNGLLDPEEDDMNGVLDPGLARYLTIYSREQNVDSQGQPRINVNDTDLKGLHEKLVDAVGDEMANYIIGYRLYGQQGGQIRIRAKIRTGSASSSKSGEVLTGITFAQDVTVDTDQVLFFVDESSVQNQNQKPDPPPKIVDGAPKQDEMDFNRQAQRQIGSVYDLIGAEFEISKRLEDGTQQRTRYRSPLQREKTDILREELPAMLDRLTTSREQELTPRININTAPREVLRTLPDLTDADVQVILDQRPTADSDPSRAADYATPAWLLTEAGFALDAVRNLEPFITTRSQVYRLQVLGYYDVAGPMVRLEAVIDVNGGRPKVLYWRDITELGRGFDLRQR